jgi:hypothetical protein
MKLRVSEVWISHSDRGCQYSAIVTRECSPHASCSSHATYAKGFEELCVFESLLVSIFVYFRVCRPGSA